MLGKCQGLYKAPRMAAEDSEKLSREGDKNKFIDIKFERQRVVGFREEEGKMLLHVLGMNL